MSREARFSVSFLRNVLYSTAALGHDLDDLCAASGVSRAIFSSPDEMLPGSVVERAWEVCLERSGDPDLGLHIGESVHPSVLGLLGFAMLSCETLGAAIGQLARHWNLMSNASEVRLYRGGLRSVTLELAVPGLPGNFLMHSRQPVESSLAAAVSIIISLAGRAIPLTDVASTFPAPANEREYLRIFGRMPRFSAESSHISFPAEALDWPVLQANPAMLAALEGQIQQRLHAVAPKTVVDRVRHQLALKLRGEVPGLEAIARDLHKSPRALQRELQLEGASFREVLDDLRADLARDYLRDPSHSIGDVSFLLGFSEPSVFHRSFRKWTGLTPQAFRRGLT